MKKPDKFLIGIVLGVVLLVVVAFALALTRPKADYQPEDMPEGVAFNYLFALQQGDLPRAYEYLSPSLRGYPVNSSAFARNIDNRSYTFSNLTTDTSTSIQIVSSTITGSTAVVRIKETRFYAGGLFDSGESTYFFDVTLEEQDGVWKITDSERYWLSCWDDYDRCN